MAKHFEFHLGQQTFLLRLRFGCGLFCAVFLIVFCILGQWQIHRYAFKKNLVDSYHHGLTAISKTPQALTGPVEALQFQPVDTVGIYDNAQTILVQNRVYHDQLGYEVLTPLRMRGDAKLLLVDRGWIPQSKAGDLAAPADEQPVHGHIKIDNEYQFILGDNVLASEGSQKVIQRIDLNDISRITNETFYPCVLRLNPEEANGFVREWTISAMQPVRHLAYAAQWFAMGLIVLIAYFCFCLERVKNAKNS